MANLLSNPGKKTGRCGYTRMDRSAEKPDDRANGQIKAESQPEGVAPAGQLSAGLPYSMRDQDFESRLADYKAPKRVNIVAEWPDHQSGKLLKRQLRTQQAERTEQASGGAGKILGLSETSTAEAWSF